MRRAVRKNIETFAYKHPGIWREVSKTVRFFRCANTAFYRKQLKKDNKDKIRVAFIVSMPEVWTSSQSVYEHMKADQRFETFLIAHPKRISKPAINEAYSFLSSQFPEVINAYQNNEWIDLKRLGCDYIIYIRPYDNEYYEDFKPANTKKYAKTCYIPYGYILISGVIFDTCYNGSFLCECSTVFHSNQSSLEINRNRFGIAAKTGMIDLVYLGFPRFDLLHRNTVSYSPGKKFTILWTPRFPTADNGFNVPGHFLDYYKDLIQYASGNSNVNLIIRPHPLMFERFRELGILSEDEITGIKNEISNAANVEMDTNKNYMVSFEKSDLLISDFSSLMIEYFYTGKPVLYCDKPELFLKEALMMDETLYHCADWQGMKQIIDGIFSGKDVLHEKREAMIDKLFSDSDNAGETIVEYIADDYAKRRAV